MDIASPQGRLSAGYLERALSRAHTMASSHATRLLLSQHPCPTPPLINSSPSLGDKLSRYTVPFAATAGGHGSFLFSPVRARRPPCSSPWPYPNCCPSTLR